METTWSHGYYTSALYTSGFYREMAPNWLDFAALIKGHRPNRREGEPFRYLELGSGMGLHLCLLAAAYPEGTFVGVDFHADQIAHSLRLRQQLGLKNITFVQGDLLNLADPTAACSLPGTEHLVPRSFHYVASHGVFTWVSASVQTALLELATRCLAIGGIFYLSYNINPGWLPNAIFQHLAEAERHRTSDAQPLEAYRRAADLLESLIGPTPEQSSPLGVQQPTLRQVLADAARADPTYLLHEYANSNWQPVWVDALHRRLLAHQLRFLGSATLPELFAELLPPFLRTIVEAEPEAPRRELCIDLALNRRFRRDLFVLGFDALSTAEQAHHLSQASLCRLSSLALDPISFYTTYGEIGGDPTLYAAIDASLQAGPATLASIAERCGRDLAGVLPLAVLALHGGQLGIDRAGQDPAVAQAANRGLLDAIATGSPFSFVAAPLVGSALPLQLQEALILHLLVSGVAPASWGEGLLRGLDLLGQKLQPSPSVSAEAAEADQTTLAQTAIEEFSAFRLPLLKDAGVVTESAL